MSAGQILIVNDDPADIGLIGGLMREEGYDVRVATSGQRALEVVLELEPDLVMVDIHLPDMDGLTFCRLLKSADKTADIPIICVADDTGQITRVQLLEQGANDVVSRPLDGAETKARVKRHITVARVRTALKESEAKFRSVMESAIDAIISADSSGAIRTWNRAAQDIFGYDASEAIGEQIELIIPERFHEAHQQGLRRVASGGQGRVIGSTVELAAVRKDGREIPVELSLATWTLDDDRYFTGILRDISERKDAERKFRSVTDSALDAIISADKHGVIRSWNKAAEETFGYTTDEAVGQLIEIIIPEQFREPHRTGMKRVSEGGQSRVIGNTVELVGLRKDGTSLPIELSLSTWNIEGEPYYSGIIRDITERKAAQEQLRAYADELSQKHEQLRVQHEELKKSQRALLASYKQAQALFSAMTDALPGTVLADKYRLEHKIAAGGFGVVFAATQVDVDGKVAIKLFRPPAEEGEEALFERFRVEGVSASRVKHPNAVAIMDTGVSPGGLPFLVMELLDGETLAARMKRNRVPPAEAVRIAADVCGVLAAAHASSIVHRDIKPSNVFLHRAADGGDDEVIKVLDFGIAKLVDETQALQLTRTGELIGTPRYMAPERLQGKLEAPASDVYSLAVLLYEMLLGRPPFAADDNVYATLWVQMNAEPDAPHAVDPTIPVELSELILRGLSRVPGDRPTAAELEQRLREILRALPEAAVDEIA